MGSTTPKYALPYPLGTDRVMDGDDAIKALAQRVETVLLPTTSGVAIVYGANCSDAFEGSRVFPSGGLAVLRYALHVSVTIVAGGTLLTVPATLMPATLTRGVGWNQGGSASANIPMTLSAAGALVAEVNTAAGTNMLGEIVYPYISA